MRDEIGASRARKTRPAGRAGGAGPLGLEGGAGPLGLDDERCWQIVVARDRRFEGRFYIGVRTTGIYCRPGCPARLPARRNVAFYPSSAAAERAGFRACKRCRPETAPGSAAAAGTSAIVARALRLIEGGALDQGSVEQLAARVGVTSRWLRQLFVERFGAGPLALALTRRTHLARRLLETSAGPVEEIALATGFGSARRLRHALGRAFGRSASRLRDGTAPPEDAGLALVLRSRGALVPAGSFAFLAPRAIPGVEVADSASWRRVAATPGGPVVVSVREAPEGLRVTLRPPAPGSVPFLVARISRMFDLEADPAGIAAALRRDPWLRAHLPAAGVRIPAAWDAFEMGVRAIVGQQISVAAARTILGRLVAVAGTPAPRPEPGLTHTFPDARALARADLARAGLTRARAESLRAFARAVEAGELALDVSPGLAEVVRRLRELPGVGDWTAQEIALRGLGEPDAFPAGDLVLRRMMADGLGLSTEREVRAHADRWRPWRGYAAVALWAAARRNELPRPAAGATRPRRRT